MPTELPFKKEEGYDYILNESDRKKFAPKLATDEYWCCDEWLPAARDPEFVSVNLYRRRRKSSGWISVKERLPENCDIVIVDGGIARYKGQRWISETSGAYGIPIEWKVTHWMDFPPLPQPPRPAAEVAFEEFMKKHPTAMASETLEYSEVWLAAIEWAKSNKGEI